MFLDTSGLFCMHNTDELRSEESVDSFEAADGKMTHNYVLAELVALSLARGMTRVKTLGFVKAILGHPQVKVIWVDETLNGIAIQLLETRPDKNYSLCDAVSFVLMRRHASLEALTTDHHFEQEGFVRLLK